MSANALDESFDNIARVAAPRLVRETLNNTTWISLLAGITPTPGARRCYLTLGACAESYELRFHEDDAHGLVVPANTLFHYPLPFAAAGASPAAKLVTGTSATLAGLLALPDTA